MNKSALGKNDNSDVAAPQNGNGDVRRNTDKDEEVQQHPTINLRGYDTKQHKPYVVDLNKHKNKKGVNASVNTSSPINLGDLNRPNKDTFYYPCNSNQKVPHSKNNKRNKWASFDARSSTPSRADDFCQWFDSPVKCAKFDDFPSPFHVPENFNSPEPYDENEFSSSSSTSSNVKVEEMSGVDSAYSAGPESTPVSSNKKDNLTPKRSNVLARTNTNVSSDIARKTIVDLANQLDAYRRKFDEQTSIRDKFTGLSFVTTAPGAFYADWISFAFNSVSCCVRDVYLSIRPHFFPVVRNLVVFYLIHKFCSRCVCKVPWPVQTTNMSLYAALQCAAIAFSPVHTTRVGGPPQSVIARIVQTGLGLVYYHTRLDYKVEVIEPPSLAPIDRRADLVALTEITHYDAAIASVRYTRSVMPDFAFFQGISDNVALADLIDVNSSGYVVGDGNMNCSIEALTQATNGGQFFQTVSKDAARAKIEQILRRTHTINMDKDRSYEFLIENTFTLADAYHDQSIRLYNRNSRPFQSPSHSTGLASWGMGIDMVKFLWLKLVLQSPEPRFPTFVSSILPYVLLSLGLSGVMLWTLYPGNLSVLQGFVLTILRRVRLGLLSGISINLLSRTHSS